MAPIQSSLSSLVFLTLASILLSITPAFSTKTGFQMTLTSVDSGGRFTHSERLQRAVKRSNNRLNQFNKMVLTANATKLSSPVFPNGETEYLMNLSIGTPPISYSALMDTGSDLIWTQCKPCIRCFPQPTPLFDPKNSSSYSNVSCSNKLCEALPFRLCDGGFCEYEYFYGGGGFTEGVLATETFTFGNISVPKIGFGCGETNGGDGLRLSAGLVGLGRGNLSLISQLGESVFSYCLTYWNGTKPSTLLIGSQPSVNSTSGGGVNKTTPLIQNPKIPTFYYVSLEGITVGSTKLPVNKTTFAINGDGSGGVIVDSGTSITYLENSAYILVRKEFISQVKLPEVNFRNPLELDLCFKLPSNASSVEIPALGFNFTNADLQFPIENYMITNSSAGVICLAMGGSDGFSIFGNMLQQNSLVVYDLFTETLSFTPTECDKF